ncbi:MAG: cysteine hydrolase [Vicinamibacteria bacterium]|nr:cysteine hydrolase [Vicinamibacteria bacterium]
MLSTELDRATLLIVDLQLGFDEKRWGRRNNPSLEQRAAEILRAWRNTGRSIVHVRHMSTDPLSPLRPGQAGNEFKPETAPRRGEAVIEKRVNSAFIGTSLEADLQRAGCRELVILGLTTNHCVSTTARMASNLGFATWVVSDATAAFDRVGPDGVAYPAEQVHAMALSDLHGEFATVIDTAALLTALETSRSARRAS